MLIGNFLEELHFIQKIESSSESNTTEVKNVTIKKALVTKVRISPLVNRLMTRRRKRRFANVRPHPLAVHLRKIYANN